MLQTVASRQTLTSLESDHGFSLWKPGFSGSSLSKESAQPVEKFKTIHKSSALDFK